VTVTYVEPGSIDARVIGENWVLVLGGVTRAGNRHSRRAVIEALDSGLDVVWFDGLEGTGGSETPDVPMVPADDRTLLIVGFADTEAKSLASRLRSPAGFQANNAARFIWRHVLRRVGSVLRPRACWAAIRPDVSSLSEAAPPAAIVIGDDYSITSAWYSGRIWRDTPLSTQLMVKSE